MSTVTLFKFNILFFKEKNKWLEFYVHLTYSLNILILLLDPGQEFDVASSVYFHNIQDVNYV